MDELATPQSRPAICVTCNRPLERREHRSGGVVIDVSYTHPDDPRGIACDNLVPLQYDPSDPPAYVTCCDFCGQMGIEWDYAAENFATYVGLDAAGRKLSFSSVGSWAACPACHEDILAKNWDAIANRHIALKPKSGMYKNDLVALFELFESKRQGDPTPTKAVQ